MARTIKFSKREILLKTEIIKEILVVVGDYLTQEGIEIRQKELILPPKVSDSANVSQLPSKPKKTVMQLAKELRKLHPEWKWRHCVKMAGEKYRSEKD